MQEYLYPHRGQLVTFSIICRAITAQFLQALVLQKQGRHRLAVSPMKKAPYLALFPTQAHFLAFFVV